MQASISEPQALAALAVGLIGSAGYPLRLVFFSFSAAFCVFRYPLSAIRYPLSAICYRFFASAGLAPVGAHNWQLPASKKKNYHCALVLRPPLRAYPGGRHSLGCCQPGTRTKPD